MLMTPEQAQAVLAGLINAPVARLALSVQELAACDLALRTLAQAAQPKPDNVTPLPAEPPKP